MTSRVLFRTIVSPFLDFVFPPVCIACNSSLPDGLHRVCTRCWDSIERITRDHPLYLETREKLVADGVVDDLVSVFVFEKEGAFQNIAHALKYSGYESVGLDLGMRLGELMNVWNVRADFVVPVPLHRAKHRERGYNQAERIARGVARVTGMRLNSGILRRIRYTQTQTQLNSEERKKNMDAAFRVSNAGLQQVRGKSFIIVDDVITTGSTIQACSEELMKAGALRIIAASAALAQ